MTTPSRVTREGSFSERLGGPIGLPVGVVFLITLIENTHFHYGPTVFRAGILNYAQRRESTGPSNSCSFPLTADFPAKRDCTWDHELKQIISVVSCFNQIILSQQLEKKHIINTDKNNWYVISTIRDLQCNLNIG